MPKLNNIFDKKDSERLIQIQENMAHIRNDVVWIPLITGIILLYTITLMASKSLFEALLFGITYMGAFIYAFYKYNLGHKMINKFFLKEYSKGRKKL